MTLESITAIKDPHLQTQLPQTQLRLDCLPAGACYVCAREMVRSSGGKWLCRACGFLLTCCDP
jgi:hypothetical protein